MLPDLHPIGAAVIRVVEGAALAAVSTNPHEAVRLMLLASLLRHPPADVVMANGREVAG